MSNNLSVQKRAQLLSCFVEGMSVRATARVCGVAFNTALKFVPMLGAACADYQDRAMRNLQCKRLQVDEIWSFVHSKDRVFPNDRPKQAGRGSIWTWLGVCADTKLVPCWHVGNRDAVAALCFMEDLASRLAHRVQLTTDGLACYLNAVEAAFGTDVDFAQLVKLYGEGPPTPERRYSPAKCIGARKVRVSGLPAYQDISTSYAERVNLSIRMGNRRFTRLTNAHSKKAENHAHAIAIFFMHYNFCRVHQTLRVTPAMAAGVSDHVWELAEVVALLDKVSEQAA